ncbi:3'-5' exonuclease [Terrisporobacter petrolearius]|uniref:3'-5' exonuclease n=1 Tax=Terrisporobacter petrolearius TaxID=1460447 RepID=UPI002F418FD8
MQHIIIDEMQDYTPIQYEVIKKIYKCKKTILGDFGQCVNQYNSNTLNTLKNIFEDSQIVHINKSYRSTYEIVNFAKKIYYTDIEPIERHGKDPQIIKCNNIKEEVQEIEKIIKKFNESKSTTLGIICKMKEEVEYSYEIFKEKYEINKLDFDSREFKEGVIISTIQMSKGLEFDEVLLPFVNNHNYSSDFDRNLLYVACTRAMNNLNLTYSNEISSLIQIN